MAARSVLQGDRVTPVTRVALRLLQALTVVLRGQVGDGAVFQVAVQCRAHEAAALGRGRHVPATCAVTERAGALGRTIFQVFRVERGRLARGLGRENGGISDGPAAVGTRGRIAGRALESWQFWLFPYLFDGKFLCLTVFSCST